MNGQRPQSISKVLIHQSALARLYFVKDFEAGHSVELKPIRHSHHLFRFAKWSEKRFKCQQKGLGRRATRLILSSLPVVFWTPLKMKCSVLNYVTHNINQNFAFVLCCFQCELVQCYDTGLVLPHNKMKCNSVCTSSARLDAAGTGLRRNSLAWHLPPT